MVALKLNRFSGVELKYTRSRNAVVALKRDHGSDGADVGIRSRNAVVALKPSPSASQGRRRSEKQERRGGIETTKRIRSHLDSRSEAGTPWWH